MAEPVGASPAADERDRIIATLQEILRELDTDGDLGVVDPDVPLRTAGLDSSALVAFLIKVEERFGITWSDDLPAGALSSLTSVADVLARAEPQAVGSEAE